MGIPRENSHKHDNAYIRRPSGYDSKQGFLAEVTVTYTIALICQAITGAGENPGD